MDRLLLRHSKAKLPVPRAAVRLGVLVAVPAVVALGGLVTTPAQAAGSTYFVDNTNSSCSDTGSGSSAQPFCTIARGVTAAQPGDTIRVLAGTYAESVNVAKSGTAGSPITYSAASGVTVTGAGAGTRGIYMSGRSYVVIDGFTVSGTSSYGIYGFGCNNVTISNNHVDHSGQPVAGQTFAGIYLNSTTNSTVSGNTTHNNTDSGILLASGDSGITVKGNTSYGNAQGYQRAAPGIDVRSGPNTVIDNISYSNEDSGLQFYTGAHDNLVADNISYNNGDHGIDDLNAPNQTIIGNTVFHNVTAGINAEGTASPGSGGVTIENNISIDNGIASPRTTSNIRVDSQSLTGSTVDYNIVDLLSGGSVELIWGTTGYSSLATYQAATGQMAHGMLANPMFVNTANGNFALTEGSPAIDSANSGVNGEQATDFAGNPRVDDPGTANTGVGPRAYDDMGALEFQPSGTTTDNPPTAQLTVAPNAGTAPLQVVGDASASTDDHGIVSYAFDWGDGTTTAAQSSPTVNHTYASAGTYVVTVTVTDTSGQTATATQSVQVSTDQPPVASLQVSPGTGAAPLLVSADASASKDDVGIASYQFDWGDGTHTGAQAGPTASHTYQSIGDYVVTLTVTDTSGQTGTATQDVTVSAADNPPTASLQVTPTSGTAPLPVTADGSASTDDHGIVSYAFAWGDGTSTPAQPGATAQHTYSAAGSYTVTLTVTDTAGQTGTATQGVQVTAASTNLFPNPGFETDLSGWAGINSTSALTRVKNGHNSQWKAVVTNTATGTALTGLTDSPNAVQSAVAGTYTAGLWVKAPTAGASLTLQLRVLNGSTVSRTVTKTVTLGTTWKKFSVQAVNVPAGRALDFSAFVSAAASGSSFWADDASLIRS